MNDYNAMNAGQLYDKRFELVLEFGKLEQELNKRRAQDRHIVRLEDQVWETRPVMEGMQLKPSKVAD